MGRRNEKWDKCSLFCRNICFSQHFTFFKCWVSLRNNSSLLLWLNITGDTCFIKLHDVWFWWGFRLQAADLMRTCFPSNRTTWQKNITLFQMKGYLPQVIMKTHLFKYIENFTSKNWKFSGKKLWYFSYICLKHRLWVLVRTASVRRF